MDIEPGTVVANRYRISRAIGRGGMGEVFAAENIRTGRPVAVKLLRADSKSKSSAVERFRREARAAGSINSDHVTQVLDVEDDAEHGIVIVFELLEGESLIDRLKRTGPIPFDELHPIIEEVWVGLSDAHKVGIIHRDLKPSNVFLERRPDGHQRVKILDFGISKLPKEMGGETLTEMGQSLGTFSFMPPEQIGRAKTVDHRADIYATTTMIYQSLTGQLPYIARNILVMVELKSKTNPRPLSEALGHPVDQALEQFVATGLARNPADRFQNALDALEKWRALKSLHVPESRRAQISVPDLNAQARAAQQAPLPAAGRPPSGVYPQDNVRNAPTSVNPAISRSGAQQRGYGQAPTGIQPSAQSGQGPYARQGTGAFGPASVIASSTGMGPPALVVPLLEPVMPGTLPRLDDPTETTTDGVSHIELVNLKQAASAENAGLAQRGQELRPSSPNEPEEGERKGPQGTKVLPPTIVQQAVAAAAARKASQGDPRSTSQQGPTSGQAPSPYSQQQPRSQQSPHSAQQPPSAQSHTGQSPRSAQQPPSGQQPRSQGVQNLQPPPRRPTPQGMAAVRPQAQPPSQQARPAQHPPSSHPPPLATPLPPSGSQVPPSGSQPPSQGGPQSHVQAVGSGAPPGPSSQAQNMGGDPRATGGGQPGPQSPRQLHQALTPFPGTPLAQVPTPFPGTQQAQVPQPYPSTSQSVPPTQTPSGALPAYRPSGPQITALKAPDEPSSVPASQDKTTVYRPKGRKPEKKQSVAVFVVGAILFAVVGFGIVFLVQYVVKTLGH